jgi:hypothetical protein
VTRLLERIAGAAAILLSAALAHVGGPPSTCEDPLPQCPPGRASGVEQHVDAFGTPPGGCATCTADPTSPGGPGCVFAQWDTQLPAPLATPLSIPKFVPPPGVSLAAVELVLRGSVCGVLRVENKVPDIGCTITSTLGARFTASPLPGQGLDALGYTSLDVLQQVVHEYAPFDGVVDFMGPSGHTEAFPELTQAACLRITDPVLLAAFVDDGVGPDSILFHHSADDESSTTICGPITFKSDPYARIELEVRYAYCAFPALAFCFGTDAACPCGNGGAPDSGCDNAQATGGVRLLATGDPTLNDVVLHGSGFPATSTPAALVIRSPLAESQPVVFGDGLRCVSLPGLVRFGATSAAGGASVHPISHGAGPGQFVYQLWYRSTPAAFCDAAAAFNTSNALAIAWP